MTVFLSGPWLDFATWVLGSLTAIALLTYHPYLGLTVAILGGVWLGISGPLLGEERASNRRGGEQIREGPPSAGRGPGQRILVLVKAAARWVADYELLFLLAAMPFLIFPGRFTRAALVLIAVLWLCRWAAYGSITRRTPLDIPILGLLMMLPVTLYASADWSLTLPKLYGILLGVALFYGIVNTAQSEARLWLMVSLFILAGLGMAGLSLVGTDWKSRKVFALPQVYARLPRLISGLTRSPQGGFHPNEVGGMLILFVPLVVSLIIPWGDRREDPRKRRHGRVWQWFWDPNRRLLQVGLMVALVGIGFTFLLTQSRSSFIGVAVALMVLGILRSRWFWLGVPVVVLATILAIQHLGMERLGDLLFMLEATGTMRGRVEVWQRAIYMIQDFSYTGIGLGTFDLVRNVLYPLFLAGPDVQIFHAHNLLLQVGVDLGIPGLVAYAGLISAFALMGCQIYRSTVGREKALAVGLLGGMLAHQVYGLTDAVALGGKPGFLVWAMLGLMVSLYIQSTPDDGHLAGDSTWQRLVDRCGGDGRR